VALAARTEADLLRVADLIAGRGGTALPVVCDVTRAESIDRALAEVRRTFGPVSVLVNNAGAAESHKFLGHDDLIWQRMIEVNLTSVYRVSKATIPDMIKASWGRIINIASVAAKVGGKYIAAYTAAKHGVLGLTRALAIELVAYDITVNAVCPGYVDTPLTDRSVANIARKTGQEEQAARDILRSLSPQNRLITPGEVATVVLMLASEDARGITGQAINVDGGMVTY